MSHCIDVQIVTFDWSRTLSTTSFTVPIEVTPDGYLLLRAAYHEAFALINDLPGMHTWTMHYGPRLLADSSGYRSNLASAIAINPRPAITHHR